MKYQDYLAHIQFDDKANVFHGEVINIRDVITFQGKAVTELRRAFEESVKDYLAFCAERGEEPNQPYTGLFTVHLSREQHRRIILAAEKTGKDVDAWVAQTLEKATAV